MTAEEQRIRYWAGMLDEAFPEEAVLTEGDHWPEDFVRRAVNKIKNSLIRKTAWYSEEKIRKDVERMTKTYEALEMTHTSKETNLFKTLVRWLIEYVGTSRRKFIDFAGDTFESIVRDLKLFTGDPDLFAEYYDRLRNGMSFSEFKAECAKLKKSKKTSDREKMKSFVASEKGYELLKIDSYEQFNDMFGGKKTGGGLDPKKGWCHANGKQTYDDWIKNGKNVFLVLCRKDWKETEPSPPQSRSFDDEYGRSAIAILVDQTTGTLLNATFRYNHAAEPNGKRTDNAVDGYAELSETAGFDVEAKVRKLIGYDEEKAKNCNVFEVKYGDGNGNIDCSKRGLESLTGAPEGVDGDFDCSQNWLMSLAGSPKETGGNFDCRGNRLSSLKGGPEFVQGIFDCRNNRLTSLEGFPKMVEGIFSCCSNRLENLEGVQRTFRYDFKCSDNRLTSLEGGPEEVGENFDCSSNMLKNNLVGAPSSVGRNFDCSYNRLTSLEGGPEEVGENFDCSSNMLKNNLVGAPSSVGRNFDCSYNGLTSLEGGPEEVGGSFNCWENCLKNLEGCPEKIEKDFNCERNRLTSLEGAPSSVGGSFVCRDNPLTTLKGAPSVVKGYFWCDGNPKLPKEAIEAYETYLKNPDPELTDETGHYRPKED